MEVFIGILVLLILFKVFALMLFILSLPFLLVVGFFASIALGFLFVFGAVFTLVFKILLLPLLLFFLIPFCWIGS